MTAHCQEWLSEPLIGKSRERICTKKREAMIFRESIPELLHPNRFQGFSCGPEHGNQLAKYCNRARGFIVQTVGQAAVHGASGSRQGFTDDVRKALGVHSAVH